MCDSARSSSRDIPQKTAERLVISGKGDHHHGWGLSRAADRLRLPATLSLAQGKSDVRHVGHRPTEGEANLRTPARQGGSVPTLIAEIQGRCCSSPM